MADTYKITLHVPKEVVTKLLKANAATNKLRPVTFSFGTVSYKSKGELVGYKANRDVVRCEGTNVPGDMHENLEIVVLPKGGRRISKGTDKNLAEKTYSEEGNEE